jgi:hypothetical protein
MKVRAILWTVTMAYTGFRLTGQGLRTFNSIWTGCKTQMDSWELA